MRTVTNLPRFAARRCVFTLALCLLACSNRNDAPVHAEPSPPAVVARPQPRAPAVPRTREYFEPDDTEDFGFNEVDGSFGFEPVDAELPEPFVIDGGRPTSVTVRDTIGPYLSTRAATLAAYTKTGGLLILTRLDGSTQVHRVDHPLGLREQLTFGPGNVVQASFDPLGSGAILFRADLDGNERYDVHHLELDTRKLRPLSVPGTHTRAYLTDRSGDILLSSYSEDGSETIISVLDVDGSPPRELFRGPGSWMLGGVSPDETRLVLREYEAADDEALDLLELDSGRVTRLYGGAPGQVCKSASFSPDGRTLDVLTNRGGDFVSLWQYELDDGSWTELTPKRKWDIEAVARSPNGKRVAVVANEDGASVVYLLDGGGKKLSTVSRSGGVVRDLRFVDSRHVIATVSSSRAPADVYAFDVLDKQATRWTKSEIGGLHPDRFIEPSVVRFESFDGREIPALYYRPRGPGPFATIIYAHGGPESQIRPSFKPFLQYLAAQRNIAVIAPNLRGSTGYGLSYMGLDDGRQRMDAIADVGALLDWIDAQPELIGERVGIVGVSYGGFVTLASLIEYGERLVAGATIVGVADIEEMLLNTAEHRRSLRRREYGDERDEATLTWMREVSPLRRAAEIVQPLFIVHGVNDSRVPVDSATKLADTVREAGGEVWLLLAQRAGHSVQESSSRDEYLQRLATFLERHLLAPPRELADTHEGEGEADQAEAEADEASEIDAGALEQTEADDDAASEPATP